MATYTKDDMIEILINDVHVTNRELNLVTKLCGDIEQVYKDVLFVYTGVSDFDYFVNEIKEN